MRNHDQAHELFVSWLKDAYAMERTLEGVLEKQAKRAAGVDPTMQHRLAQHTKETRRHAELVERALQRHGSKSSAMKVAGGKMEAAFMNMFSAAGSDTRVKDALSGIAAEHFEIACYRALAAAARLLGDEETVRTCEDILKDEEQMASFLEDQLPRVTELELVTSEA